jgi:hypothetical protein
MSATLTPTSTPTHIPTLLPLPTNTSTPTLTLAPTAPLTPTHTATATQTPTSVPSLTPRPTGNCADPNAKIANLQNNQRVSSSFKLIGTANGSDFSRYEIEFEIAGVWYPIHISPVPVKDNALMSEPQGLSKGTYTLRLVVYLKDFSSLAPCQYTITVE